MSRLRIHPDDDPQSYEEFVDPRDIAAAAARAGYRFDRWASTGELPAGLTDEGLLERFAGPIAELAEQCDFVTSDVVSVTPDTPRHAELRGKFLAEHTHSEDEARFFARGSGLFCLHLGQAVHALRCEAGDLVNVPAGTKHWFDMGPRPDFRCIRVFADPQGWVAAFTGSDIARHFPPMESPTT